VVLIAIRDLEPKRRNPEHPNDLAIGAKSWSEMARRELRAAGEVTGVATRLAAHEQLSAQELQVARLVAEGLSNKQVGERLYLSPRTIGSHLYRIFPKLDITSRGQMAGRLRSC
jgi:DNA-binding CsgD family transcriptional regulator